MFFEGLIVLSPRIFVIRLQLADLLKILNRQLKLVKRQISTSKSVVSLEVGWVTLNCISGVKKGQRVVFSLDADLGSVAVENGLQLWRDVQEDGF